MKTSPFLGNIITLATHLDFVSCSFAAFPESTVRLAHEDVFAIVAVLRPVELLSRAEAAAEVSLIIYNLGKAKRTRSSGWHARWDDPWQRRGIYLVSHMLQLVYQVKTYLSQGKTLAQQLNLNQR